MALGVACFRYLIKRFKSSFSDFQRYLLKFYKLSCIKEFAPHPRALRSFLSIDLQYRRHVEVH